MGTGAPGGRRGDRGPNGRDGPRGRCPSSRSSRPRGHGDVLPDAWWGRPRSRGAQPSCAISIARRAALDGPGFVGTTPGPRTAGRWGAAARRRSPAPSWDVVRSGEAAGRGVGRCGRARRWADAQRPPKRNRSVTPRRHTTPSQRALRSLHRAHRFAPGTRDRSPRRTPETVTTSGPTHPRSPESGRSGLVRTGVTAGRGTPPRPRRPPSARARRDPGDGRGGGRRRPPRGPRPGPPRRGRRA